MGVKESPKHETKQGKSKKEHSMSLLGDWFKLDFDDSWYLYALLVGCLGIMMLVLIHKKLTRQKGTWTKNLNFKNIYLYNSPQQSQSGNRTESRGELECRKFLETVFQVPFSKARPSFLRNPVTGNNLEIDCYNPILRLGVEYNGKQHYSYTSYFHRNKEASLNQQYRDELKRRMCLENNVNLIEVPYTIKISDIGPFLSFKLKQLGYLV